MALEDITEDVQEETKKEKTEDLSDELGLEDKEELEKFNENITRLHEMIESIDRQLEELEKDMRVNRGAIVAVMEEIGNPEDSTVKSVSKDTPTFGGEEITKVQQDKDDDENPWLSGD